MDDSLADSLADTVLEMAAQDEAAGGLEEFTMEELLERRARMEVREHEERTGDSLPPNAVAEVLRLAKKRYWAEK